MPNAEDITTSSGGTPAKPTLGTETSSDSQRGVQTLAPGQTLARYSIIDLLGHGGMGAVYRAYDVELERQVAIKVMRAPSDDATVDGSPSKTRQSGIASEARALAKISHPHIVPVFDVGRTDDAVFMAMELVRGLPFDEWLSVRRRTMPEIMAVLLPMGAALEELHRHGMVHRDFKPANFVVDESGRSLLLDFGIVGGTEDSVDTISMLGLCESTVTGMSCGLVTGLGTPRYMAPEQHERTPADPRMDVYAFCLVVYEAVVGRHAFAEVEQSKLPMAKLAGIEWGRGRQANMPGWLRKILTKGLSADPEDRHDDMGELLRALRFGLSAPRRRMKTMAAAALVVGAMQWVSSSGTSAEQALHDCRAQADRLLDSWQHQSPSAKNYFRDSGHRWALDTWARVDPKMLAYAENWQTAWSDNCLARYGEDSQRNSQVRSTRTPQLSAACLEQHARAFSAMGELLRSAPQTLMRHASEAVASLPPGQQCFDHGAVTHPLPDDAEQAKRVISLRNALVEGQIMTTAGKYEQAISTVESRLPEVAQLDYGPLLAEFYLQLAQIAGAQLSSSLAADWAESAMQLATAHGHDRVVAEAGLVRIHSLGYLGYFHRQLGTEIRMEKTAIARSGMADELNARLLRTEVGLLMMAEDPALLLAKARENLTVLESQGERDPTVLGSVMMNLGTALTMNGDMVGARDFRVRGLALMEQGLGESHPELLLPLANAGDSEVKLGNFATATRFFERAMEIAEHEKASLAASQKIPLMHLYAVLLELEGDLVGARDLYTRYVEVFLRSISARSPRLFNIYGELAAINLRLGDAEAARSWDRRRAELAQALPEQPFDLLDAQLKSAQAQLWAGDSFAARLALAQAEQAHAQLVAAHGDEDGVTFLQYPLRFAIEMSALDFDAAAEIASSWYDDVRRAFPEANAARIAPLVALGRAREKLGQLTVAQQHFERASELAASWVSPHSRLGIEPSFRWAQMQLEQGRSLEAATALARVMKVARLERMDRRFAAEVEAAWASIDADTRSRAQLEVSATDLPAG